MEKEQVLIQKEQVLIEQAQVLENERQKVELLMQQLADVQKHNKKRNYRLCGTMLNNDHFGIFGRINSPAIDRIHRNLVFNATICRQNQ